MTESADLRAEVAECDRCVQAAEEAIDRLRKSRRDPETGFWTTTPLTDAVRARIAGFLRERLVALRRKEQIQRGCA
jgi:hypothetical protein